jgi:hypothetical protein
MTAAVQAVLDAVAHRAETEPEAVVPTLRLLADLDALPDSGDTQTVDLAHRLNAQRLIARRDQFRAHALSTSEVRAVLGGVSRQAVAARVANKSLLALEIGGRLHFPDWQFGGDGVLTGVPEVVAVLSRSGRGALAADALMRGGVPEAGGRSPAQMLAAGEVEDAVHYIRIAGGG